ncbi:MAG TPA: PAS domain S-box protein, partial [Nitrospirota bacterium]|nr:PAS domain S-box protein [Nitrospirota bacterium]
MNADRGPENGLAVSASINAAQITPAGFLCQSGISMSKLKKTSNKITDLRKKAGKKLSTQLERLQTLSAKGTHDLVQELGTHQIELEMQNEELRRAQTDLEASRSKYSDLYDFAPVGHFTFDPAGVLREINLTAAKMLGVERRSLVNKPFSSFLSKDDNDAFRLHCAAVLENRTKQTIEIRLKRKDRTEFFALLESIAVENHEGNVVAIRTAASDITERRRSERALQESELRYRSLFENMLDGYAYCRMLYDDRGRPMDFVYLSVNSAFERLTGLKDVVGKRVTDVIPGIRESHPDLLETYGRVAATGKTEKFEIEFKPLGIWLSISVYSTERDHFTAVFDNITERKLAEEALRQSREDMARAQAVGQIGSWRLDVNRNVLTWSDENHRIFGLPKGTPMSYETFMESVHPDDREYVDGKWKAALAGEPYDIEHRIVADGIIKWVREKAYLEFGKDGGLLGGFGITQDITERKQAEDALRESSDRYRSYVEVTGQLGWTTDAEGKVEEDIPSWRAYTGQTYDEVKGWGWSQALHPDDLEQTSRSWREAITAKTSYETEYRIRRYDGIYRHFMARGIPLLNEDGSVREWVGTCIDISERKRAEEALKKAHAELELRVEERTRELSVANESVKTERQRLFSVLETLPVYVILLDADHRIPFANHFFRYRFGESNGRRCYEYLFNRTEPCEICETYTVLKTNAPHHWYWTGPDGRDYDIYDFPFIDTDGSAMILEMGIDITDQKKAQQALKETITELKEATHRTALINELLILFTREHGRAAFLDSAVGLIRQWSGCRHVGIRVPDEQGCIPYASCAGFNEEFLASERTLSLERDHCACTRVVRGAPEPQDLSAMTRGGSFYSNNTAQFVEGLNEEQRSRFRGVCIKSGFLSVGVVPLRYRDKVMGAIHIADERENMLPLASMEHLEQVALIIGEALFRFEVEEERVRLASALESSADGVVITNPKSGRIEYVNRAFEQITGYTRSETIGNTLHLLDSGKHDEAFYRELRAALARDGVWRGVLINRKKDGMLYYEECSFSPVREPNGSIVNYVSVKRDVTEKLRLESIAESVTSMNNIGYIFAGVRHEIGNPINSAKMMLSVLQLKLETAAKETIKNYVDRSLVEIGRVENLLRNLKNFNLYETPELRNLHLPSFMREFRNLISEDLK